MKRKLVIVLLLGAALEVAWLVGGLELLRGKLDSGPVGRLKQEVNQAKTMIAKASEGFKALQAALEEAPMKGSPASPADPLRNPFALPQGVRVLTDPSGTADPKALGEAGASTEKDPARAAPPERQLSGILVGPRDRVAIIDGALVRAGDSLDDERVLEIRRDHVVLARDDQRRTLRLPPPFPEPKLETEQLKIRSATDGVRPKTSNGAAKP